MQDNLGNVNRAFSKQSERYDEYDSCNEILIWMRKKVRKHVLANLKEGDRILELNAGTGLDALYFVERGFTVYATDLSDGMISQMEQKKSDYKLDQKLIVKQCSYTELDLLNGEKFDYVFSNFGGLNCIPNIKSVTRHLSLLLKPNAIITFVIMPPVCPWEIGKLFKGKWKEAFRRFNKKGIQAHLEGKYFTTYYFKPSQVVKAFGNEYKKIKLEGLATFSPPPYADKFPHKYPLSYKLLTTLDEKTSLIAPFKFWADHFILSMKYSPNNNSAS